MKSKHGVRREIRLKRESLTEEEKVRRSLLVAARVLELLEKEEQVYVYIDLEKEAGTRDLIARLWENGIRVAAPRVEGKELRFYEIRSEEELTAGFHGIPEPKLGCMEAAWPQAPVIVPGVAFDPKGGRTGYGGGYYDRFLQREPEHRTIGYCFQFQIYEEGLEMESHDRIMDVVVTDERIYEKRGNSYESGRNRSESESSFKNSGKYGTE